jgi:tripartite-type tricarboxylate transporter receptor subunit TctC
LISLVLKARIISPKEPCMTKFLAALLACAAAIPAAAQYPSKPIRFIVPFPPGGGTDTNSRALTQRIAKNTGWTFVVENKPGAGGNIGAEQAAKSAPDGYTVVMGQTSNLAINPFLYAKPPFDAQKDFAPVALVSSVPLVIVSSAKAPYRSMDDVIRAAKAKPDTVSFASPGNGTVGHLAGELIARTGGVKLVHVPYKGAGPALTDLIGGQVDLYLSTPQAAVGQIKAGTVHALAVTSHARVAALPQVATLAEQKLGAAEVASWYGVLAPAGTPEPILARLNAEVNKALQAPEVRESLTGEGGSVLGGSPARFAAFLKEEQARWSKVVKDSGAKAD